MTQYHQQELQRAQDPEGRLHLLPPFPKHGRILDLGCGMGQTLIAAQFEEGVEAWGIDIDRELVDLGKKLVPSHVTLLYGSGESIPFEDESFDMIFSRVALPYMRIESVLREMHRTLAPIGYVWFVLHTRRMFTERLGRSLRKGKLKDVIFCLYILCNGLLFNSFGIQLSYFGRRMESYQTRSGMLKAFKRCGFTGIGFAAAPQPTLLVAFATKKSSVTG